MLVSLRMNEKKKRKGYAMDLSLAIDPPFPDIFCCCQGDVAIDKLWKEDEERELEQSLQQQ